MEPAKDEILTLEEPNLNFSKLPDHVQAQVLANCDFKTLMNVTETCKLLNEFVFSELSLAKRIQLRLTWTFGLCNAFEILRASDRRYRVISIRGLEYDTNENIKILELKGSFIHELTIYCPKLELLEQVLILCKNLEKLRILDTYTERVMYKKLVCLPKLKSLETPLSMVGIFSNVNGLEKLKVYHRDRDFTKDASVDILEELILQQRNLKTLKIYAKLPRGLFPEHRLKDVKFQLENFGARTFVLNSCESAEGFFKMQRESLKKVKMTDFIDRQNFEQNRDKSMRMIQEIFSLPHLKCLKVLRGYFNELPHFNEISNVLSTTRIANQSIETIYCDYELHDLAGLIASHPNLKKLKLKTPSSGIFKIDFPTNFLEMIEVDCHDIYYEPAILPSDTQRAADDLLKFFSHNKHHRNREVALSCVIIGDESWIDNDFSLPLSFWEEFSQIFRFTDTSIGSIKFTTYNIKTLEMIYFLDESGGFNSIEIYTKNGMLAFTKRGTYEKLGNENIGNGKVRNESIRN